MPRKLDPEMVAIWSRQLREAEGLSQRQLAERVGCGRGVIGSLERGVVRSHRVAKAILAMSPRNMEDLV